MVVEKTAMKRTYVDYTYYNTYDLDSAPTKGSAKLLVIPVWFTDSSNFISESKKETVRSDIQAAYFGTEGAVGWHSVKSFYETESQGRLTLEGTVSSWYECKKSTSTYYTSYDDTMDLVKPAVDWYFSNNTGESRKDYDRDGDGYLDGVMLIYGAPDYSSWGKSSYENLWAYCYWLQETNYNSKNNPGPNTFFWASYDFMYNSSKASTRTGKSSYGGGDCSHASLDAHTYIHEMGHVFGLDDYYDYGSPGYCPAAGFSMQDYNVGGHDPYSVMAMGWADPYIPTQSCDITISAFQKNHDLILLTPSWNSYDSPFDEYLLLELYTPTGLNAFDSTYSYSGNYPKGPNVPGIRLWHVDARLAYCSSLTAAGEPVYKYAQLTTNPAYNAAYGITHAFSNTVGNADYGSVLGSSYYNYHLLSLVRNSTSESVNTTSLLSSSDLFRNGSSFSMSTYSSQFVKSGKLNSNVSLGWSFSVSLSGTGDNAQATIHLTKA